MLFNKTSRGQDATTRKRPRSAGAGIDYLCPKCGLTYSFPRGTKMLDLVCPECGTRLVRKQDGAYKTAGLEQIQFES